MENKHENFGGKKKGMADYRASLTREAYERDPSKCLRIITNILDDAEKGDPVCRKIFAQSYMTKAPAEVQMTINNKSGLSDAEARKMIAHFIGKGLSEAEAAKKVMEVGHLLEMVKEDMPE